MEMALWQSSGHALAPLLILGRIGGVSDDEILAAWAEERREDVLRAVVGRRIGGRGQVGDAREVLRTAHFADVPGA
jgi:hypothetical protein